MNLPGKLGFPLIGDQSINFVRNPVGFVNQHISHYGPIFKTRILNKPFVFITSQSGVQEVLEDKSDSFERCFQDLLSGLFESNIAFLNGSAYNEIHDLIKPVFSPVMLEKYRQDISRITTQFLSELELSSPFDLYQTLKQVITEISMFIFIGIDRSDPNFERTKELLTEHWHGLISIPLPIRVPHLFSSGYDKALLAKEQLIAILRAHLSQPPDARHGALAAVDVSKFKSVEEAASNFMLFATAIIPKGITSLLVSFCLQFALPENLHMRAASYDDQYFNCMLKEVQRLFPPFLGTMRNTTKNVRINGYEIPRDYSVVIMTYHVHRDGILFPETDRFIPERWMTMEARNAKLWTFGGGERTCLGKHLSQMIISDCAKALRDNFIWEILPGQDFSYKWIPVSRPANGVMVRMKKNNAIELPIPPAEESVKST